MDYADKLRALADYLDDHPLIAAERSSHWDYPSMYVYASDWDHFQDLILHLDGFEKTGSNGSLTATHREREVEEVLFRVDVMVSGVCEARPKLDDDGKPVTRKKRVFVDIDEEEVVMEYDCPKVWTQ